MPFQSGITLSSSAALERKIFFVAAKIRGLSASINPQQVFLFWIFEEQSNTVTKDTFPWFSSFPFHFLTFLVYVFKVFSQNWPVAHL